MSFSPGKSIARGRWQPSGGVVTMTTDDDLPADHPAWEVGQLVEVQPRTWAGINRLGGHGKITKVHLNNTGEVESLDVQYIINGGHDTNLDPDLVKPYQELSRRGRSRRTRNVFPPGQQMEKENEDKPKQRSKSLSAIRVRSASKPRNLVEKEKKESRLPKNEQKTDKRKVASRKQVIPIALKDEQFEEACSIGDGIPREIVVPRQQKDKNSSNNTFKVSPLGNMHSKSQSRKRSSPAVSMGVFDEVSAPRDSESFSAAAHAVSSVSPRAETRAKRLATGHLSDSGENNLTNQSPPASPSDHAYGISQPRVHITLEQVYNDQKREATLFINDVVAGRQEAPEETQPESLQPPPVPSPTDERQNAFRQLLNELLMVNDMAMDEDTIMDQVNHCSKQRRQDGIQFSPEETEKFIEDLAGQNKIMRSDGMIISI